MAPRSFNYNRKMVFLTEYKTVQLPKQMLELVKEIICNNPELGYASQMSFVKDAVRRRIEQLYTNGNLELRQHRSNKASARAISVCQKQFGARVNVRNLRPKL